MLRERFLVQVKSVKPNSKRSAALALGRIDYGLTGGSVREVVQALLDQLEPAGQVIRGY
jgi:hypothetical protein